MATYWDVVEYLDKMLAQFEKDPPDSDFERGYLEALRELRRVAESERTVTS